MTTFLVSKIQPGTHSGFKAPIDVREILHSEGVSPVDRATPSSLITAKRDAFRLAGRLRRMSSKDVIVFQYPSGVLPDQLMAMVKDPLLVAYVHDLESLRRADTLSPAESRRLQLFDVVVVHTPAMARAVRESVSGATRVVVLGMFDYLVDDGARPTPTPAASPDHLYFVGNLKPDKSGFLYSAPTLPANLTVYGVDFGRDLGDRGLTWGGVLGMGSPDLPVDGFGLVWDGDSAERLEGPLGRYLNYNAPHKFSFYVTAGVPVIVASSSALAPMVRELGIGLCTDDVSGAADLVAACSSRDWLQMCGAVAELREKVTTGWHTRRAVEDASHVAG